MPVSDVSQEKTAAWTVALVTIVPAINGFGYGGYRYITNKSDLVNFGVVKRLLDRQYSNTGEGLT